MKTLGIANLVVPFAKVFQGQWDLVWIDTGRFRSGDGRLICEVPSRAPTTDDWFNHLSGRDGIAIGTYCYKDGMQSSYGCIDIDDGSISSVSSLKIASNSLGLEPMIELSKGKGYHVWFFFQGLMQASKVRNMLIQVCKVAEYEYDELFPKQTTGDNKGNVMRLPYAGRLPERHRFFDDDGQLLDLRQFLGSVKFNSHSDIIRVADLLEESLDLELSLVEHEEPRPWDGRVSTKLEGKDFYEVYLGRKDIESGQRNRQFHTLSMYLVSETGARLSYDGAIEILGRVYELQTPDKAGFSFNEVEGTLKSAMVRKRQKPA
jgi:hypothetical protein